MCLTYVVTFHIANINIFLKVPKFSGVNLLAFVHFSVKGQILRQLGRNMYSLHGDAGRGLSL